MAEVAIITGITRPTAHRLVQTLVAEGFLSQNSGDGRLSPGFSVLQLAGRLLDSNRLRLEALPHLESSHRAAASAPTSASFTAASFSSSPVWKSRRSRRSTAVSARQRRPIASRSGRRSSPSCRAARA